MRNINIISWSRKIEGRYMGIAVAEDGNQELLEKTAWSSRSDNAERKAKRRLKEDLREKYGWNG